MCNLTARSSVMLWVKIHDLMMKNYLDMQGLSFCTKFDWVNSTPLVGHIKQILG